MARPWDRLHPKDAVRLQEALLQDLIRRYVYPLSPFYRRLFEEHDIKPRHISRLEDLARLPLVSREEFDPTAEDAWRPFRALLRPDERSLKRWATRAVLRRVAREKLLRGDLAAERLVAEEFKPVHLHLPARGGPVVGYTMRDLSGLSQAGARAMAVMAANRADVLISTLPYGPHLPFWQAYYAAQGSGIAALHLGAGGVVRPARAAHWMHRAGGSLLFSEPGYAEGFLRGAPPEVFSRLRTLGLWATAGMGGARERFTMLLRTGGAPDAIVTTLFGVPEARVPWAECPPALGHPETTHGYHAYPDLEYLEVVDPRTEEVVGEEEPGELVYTSLDWRGSALLRFRTGVIARRGITRARCPGCGRSVQRLLPDISYREWQVSVIGSRGRVNVDLADVLPLLWQAHGVPLWQIDVARGGGPEGTDLVQAYLGGALEEDVRELQRSLAPHGVRCRMVDLRDLGRRMGVGTERPEERVVVGPASVRGEGRRPGRMPPPRVPPPTPRPPAPPREAPPRSAPSGEAPPGPLPPGPPPQG